MPLLTCNCPKCKSPLRFDAGSQQLVNITCPKCAQSFQVKVSTPTAASERSAPLSTSTNSAASNPAASFGSTTYDPFSDPVADWNQPLPLDANRQFAFQSQPKRRKKSSASGRSFVLPAVIALASLGGVGLILVAIMLGKQFLVDGKLFGELSSPFSGSLFGSDSASRIKADLATLCKQVEEIGRSIPAGDQSQASAQRLEAELPKFDALFRRICRLPVQQKSLEEIAVEMEKQGQLLQGLRDEMLKQGSAAANAPMPEVFWRLRATAKPDDLVNHAFNKVVRARMDFNWISPWGHYGLPDPLTYTGTDFEWSDEDRRVLAIIRLQGSLERDALRSLAAIDPQAPSSKELLELHSIVDEAIAESKELQKLPCKALNAITALVPKGNPYEIQQTAASSRLHTLRQLMEAEATLPVEVSFLFDEVSAVSDRIESIIFGAPHALASSLGTGETSQKRFEDVLATIKKKELAAIQAEADRKEEAQRQLAAAQQRQQNAIEEQRKREEDRKRAVEERKQQMADIAMGNAGRERGGRGRGESSEPVGPRSGRGGPPSAFDGEPSDRRGRGPQHGSPQDSRGPGSGLPAMPQDRVQRPPAQPSDPAMMVTITATNVKNLDSSSYTRALPKWLLTYAPSLTISNGSLTIKIQNYDKPLAELETCFPTLEFVSVDSESRTIVAKEK